ncbi:MAG: hypothetical protein JW959_13060, partial [Pirellulales bacterium]|nr:hypothetical protein [Pirellulales bacterium]
MSFSTFLPTRPAKQAIFILAAACAVGWTTFAAAGGGPENVLLVVNPKSSASLTIANHFVKLRQIPDDNLLFLPWEAGRHTVNVDAFRARILLPVIKAIKEQKLAEQIDYIVYSSDFPWAVSLESDVAKFAERMRRESPPSDTKGSDDKPNDKNDKKSEATSIWPKQLTPVGSLNGLTYLWRPVLAGVPSYFEPHANLYMRPLGDEDEAPPSVGFRYETHRCFLSTMLGVTVGRGNTVEEVIDYLGRAAAADGSRPKGTIYFVQNDDIRSKVRHGLFPAAIEELKKLGVRAEIVRGKVPVNKPDVQGVVAGTASFNWKSSGSTILPGAICEHFTSFGGVMRKESSQAPLSEFLRHGAAGASGTVTEPFAIPQKFPSPMVQVHYARGCTLAEAFYQSV